MIVCLQAPIAFIQAHGFLAILLIYLSAFLSFFIKKPWRPSDKEEKLPAIEVAYDKPKLVSPSLLARYRTLTGWGPVVPLRAAAAPPAPPVTPAEAAGEPSAAPPAQESTEIAEEREPHVPIVFLITQTFQLAMAVLFSFKFPYRVLGSVVNRRARYTLHRPITAGDRLLHSCKLNPEPRRTAGGHLEFDLNLSSRLVSTAELAWSATLTLVLFNPEAKKVKREPPAPAPAPKVTEAPLEAAAAAVSTAAGQLQAVAGQVKEQIQAAAGAAAAAVAPAVKLHPLPPKLELKEEVGRQYALMDGDISPMHLWPWTARLTGFPGVVANVHLVAGMVEAVLAEAISADGQLPVPATLELEFKSPTILPTTLTVCTPVFSKDENARSELARLAHSPKGLPFGVLSLSPPKGKKAEAKAEGEEAAPAGEGAAPAAPVKEVKEVVTGTLLLRQP